ncbi:MAG: hypothetical protein DIJKHBIC_04322 [Thermoanaerobaculia bacterium]|nr:hypothetical protein [Thermoanaerobaculia bacterium]
MQSETLIRAGFATGTTVGLLVMFHGLQKIVSPQHTLIGDMRGKNPAYQFVQVGHALAVLLLIPGVVREALGEPTLGIGAIWAAVFSLAGVVLIQIVGSLGIRLLLRSTLTAELDSGNAAAGIAGGVNYVAIGILASRAVAGSDLRGLGLAVVFFCLAVVTHAVFVALFRALTAYDDSEQIQGENLAAALSYAGVTVAVALILARALEGDFTGWASSLTGFGWVAAAVLALYPVRQIIVQGLILGRAPTLRGGALDDSIGAERNSGMAAMEALTYLAAAFVIVSLV